MTLLTNKKMDIWQKDRTIKIFNKWFRAFLDKERAIAGNKLYTFPTNARRCFIKELVGDQLTKRDIQFMKEYGVKKHEKR